MIRSAALVALTLLSIASASASSPIPAPEIDFAKEDRAQNHANIDPWDLPSPPVLSFEGADGVELSNGDSVIASVVCSRHRCKPYIALFTPAGDGEATLKRRVTLTTLPVDTTAMTIYQTFIFPFTNAEAQQFIVTFGVDGYSRPGLGSLNRTYIAIVNLPDLSVALVKQDSNGGTVAIDDACSRDFERVDLDGDGNYDLRFNGECSEDCDYAKDSGARECATHRKLPEEIYYWRPKTRRYELAKKGPKK